MAKDELKIELLRPSNSYTTGELFCSAVQGCTYHKLNCPKTKKHDLDDTIFLGKTDHCRSNRFCSLFCTADFKKNNFCSFDPELVLIKNA